MREQALRAILLIQAVEESDSKGELLPLAERVEATQRVLADAAANIWDSSSPDTLPRAAERLLARRALYLQERLRLRVPITDHLLAVATGSAARDALLVAAFIAGVLLAALNGRGYIEIISLPLVALLVWNLLTYVLRMASLARRRPSSVSGIPALYARWMGNRAGAVLRRARSFNAPLAAALPRFASDWAAVARPLVLQRAKRLFHICALLVAAAFVAGLLVRGYLLRDAAGWGSSFLAASVARIFLWLLYAPAAALAGVSLPASAQEMQALHVGADLAGAAAGPWIALIAWTVSIYIIAPRLIAATVISLRLWQVATRLRLPASVIPYARRTLAATPPAVQGVELQEPV
jgi:hypothetical protein